MCFKIHKHFKLPPKQDLWRYLAHHLNFDTIFAHRVYIKNSIIIFLQLVIQKRERYGKNKIILRTGKLTKQEEKVWSMNTNNG